MKRILFVILLVGAGAFGYCLRAEAADALTFRLEQAEAFRHVLEDGDWLILARLYLVPAEQTQLTDTFTVSTTGGDFDDPVTLTNSIYVTSGTDFVVEADSTDITTACGLGQDLKTINCTTTGLADNSYTVVVEYRSGWNAYSGRDVFVRLDDTGTVLVERTAADVGYALVGVYMNAADVTALAVTWGDVNITLQALGTPNEWTTPHTVTATITWQATADQDATEVTLTAQLLNMLATIEQDDAAVGSGDYIQPAGITDAGLQLSIDAFSLIRSAVPEAFLTANISPFPTAVSTPNASAVEAIDTATEATSLYSDFQDLHPMAGLLTTLLVSIGVGGLFFVKTRSSALGALTWWVAMMGGWLLFAIPFPLVFIPAAAIIAALFGWLARAVFE